MRLISYMQNGQAGVGVMVDDKGFVALAKAAPDLPKSLKAILALPTGLDRARDAAKGKKADATIADVQLLPVIPDPQAIWCLALNYKEHIEETGLTTNPDFPHIFLRVPCSQVGHEQPLVKHTHTNAFDYEGELAVVIGKTARHVAEKDAKSFVAGYSCYNEGSVREYQRHNRNFGIGKNFEKSGSFGPWLMTTDELPNPEKSRVITRLNGDEKQNTIAGEMIFSIENLIHYISTGHTLFPGDVIVCGTPGAIPGKKAHMNVGDVCEVEVTGVGTLRNKVIAETPPAPAYAAREAVHAK